MAPRPKRRDEWHRTTAGTWTCTLGKRGGVVVTLFEKRTSGYYYVDVHRPGARRERKTLNTRNRAEADALGRTMYAQAMLGVHPDVQQAKGGHDVPRRKSPRLGELCERFLAECPELLDNAVAGQREARTRLAIIRSVLGDDREVATLSKNDAKRYELRRRAGGIAYGKDRNGCSLVTGPVRQRALQADLKLLKQVLEWACNEMGADGEPWLLRNPLRKYKAREEPDARRPVATHDRFLATRAAMVAMRKRFESEAIHETSPKARRRAESRAQTWLRAELALVLLEATGRRRGAVAALRWQDIDFEKQQITWRAEYDKKRTTWTTRYPRELVEEIRAFQSRLSAVGGFLFPRRKDGHNGSTRPELLTQWVAKAEKRAGLSKLDGSLCHAYRRKWKSERAHLPIKAVATAGGWKDIPTMLKYDVPDDQAILEVTSSPRRRWDRVPSQGEARTR